LLALAGDIDFEEDTLAGVDEEDSIDGDNIEGWVDECATMSKEEVNELDESVAPVRLLLTKVNQ
jgi:hypothetical protein